MSESKMYITGSELLNREINELPTLWHPYLPKVGVVGLTGSSDTGKSTFLRQLAIAITLNKTEFLNLPLKPQYGKVIYISTEDGEDAIAFGLKKQLKNFPPEKIIGLKFIINKNDPLKVLRNTLTVERVDVVIIDAWGDVFQGNPNNIVDVRRGLNELSILSKDHECLIIVLHHTVKNAEFFNPDKNKLNGSQGMEAKLRALLELRDKDQNHKALTVLKGNYLSKSQKQKSLVLRFDEERLLFFNSNQFVDRQSFHDGSKFTYRNNQVLVSRIKGLRDNDKLSYDKIHDNLVIELGEDNAPSKGTIMNICKSVNEQSP